MNRRILFQVTAPALLIGAVLLGTCAISAWYITRLQASMSNLLAANVASLKAAQELEVCVRQLRIHTLLNLSDPGPDRQLKIRKDQDSFEAILQKARELASADQEKECVQTIGNEYRLYKTELASLEENQAATGKPLGRLADDHPVTRVVEPCQKLLKLNQESIDRTTAESIRVSAEARQAMLLAGLAGPIGGVIIGYGVARTLSRSIYQLSVRVQNMAQRLDQDVASISIAADGDLNSLDQQLQHVIKKVEEVAGRVQRHQSEMLRAEQLSAVGQLGASVAHEVRNPLTGIKILVDAALRAQDARPLTREDLRIIRGEIARLEKTVQGLLDFARPPAPQRGVVQLQAAIRTALDLVRARAQQQHVDIAVDPVPHDVAVFADNWQLHTVLVNLMMNALDAMPTGGQLQILLERAINGQAQLSISDTGTGVSVAMIDKLFTPFASSKPTGTGLGLSISRRIIEEHGGKITAANQPTRGACFTITLPTLNESPDALASNPTASGAA
jgi:two-component system, NtrC family, sensor histidine kinase HydH